jgi:hypothetical protein
VAEGDGAEASGTGPVKEEGVAGRTGRGLEVALPPPVAPDQRAVRDAERLAEGGDGGGLGGAVGAEAVVDGRGFDRSAAVPSPGVGEEQERRGIAAAGDRDAERAGGRAVEDGFEEAPQRSGGYWQLSAWRWAGTWAATSLPG